MQQTSPLHLVPVVVPAQDCQPAMTLLFILLLLPLIHHTLTLANIQQRPTNCTGMDTTSVHFHEQLELSAYELGKLNLPVQSLEAVNTSGLETHYNPCQDYGQMDISDTYFKHALCPWKYECDHDPTRFPAYILHAQCSTELEEVAYESFDVEHRCQCRPLTFLLKVLRFVGCSPDTGMEQWEMAEQTVNVGCRCEQISAF